MIIQSEVELLDGESQAWLEAELVSEGDEYEWGEAGIPIGKVVQCVPGQGAVIVGADGSAIEVDRCGGSVVGKVLYLKVEK